MRRRVPNIRDSSRVAPELAAETRASGSVVALGAGADSSARFAVTEHIGYPELQEALESYAYELSQRLGRLLSREEATALWYEVQRARRRRLPELLPQRVT